MKTIRLPFRLKAPVLACGADMKGAFALAASDKAYLEDGFGDLADPDNISLYERSVKGAIKRLRIEPKIIACDMHPGYFSTRFAGNLQLKTYNLQLFYKVQHHEAHVAAAIADNAIEGDVIGVAFDGTGFGSDGNIWGGEFFIGSPRRFRRVAHLEYMTMPGADAAIREPWRMAVSYLYKTFGSAFLKKVKNADKALFMKTMIDRKINSPMTSSAGRLFDAAASIILGREKASFEAELPVELEKTAMKSCADSYDFDIKDKGGVSVLCVEKTFRGVMKDIDLGADRRLMSAKFHNTVAEMLVRTALKLKRRSGMDRVVLSGGVFQNRYLSDKVTAGLKAGGFKVYAHSRVSATDSALPLGQIAIAHARSGCV